MFGLQRSGALAIAAVLLTTVQLSLAANSTTQYVEWTDLDGMVTYLADDRKPALYTQNFGDCLGSSVVNVTRFDAAYYKDNMTVVFHLEGDTAVVSESVMMYIGVFAYGESRFDLTFNPCSANIASLCPMNGSVPISASGIIPDVGDSTANIPSIALSIPDFEGEAILRIFANSTESEIGCYSAVITNGATFSQPASVGTILGLFALVALFASFATAVYGDSVPVMRKHYAHSLSVLVVFAVYQHIFFTGALSMNWPSVLVAWWSNFAWAGGMIYSSSMQASIDHLIGNNIGNTSEIGAAGSGTDQQSVGGGYDISLIYKRALNFRPNGDIAGDIFRRHHSHDLQRRAIANSSDGYGWYGKPIGEGLPLPGNYSGFAGTLAEEGIRVSNAFMTGFLWFLILFVLVVAAVVAFKWMLEGLTTAHLMKRDRLSYFRQHWIGFTILAALRTLFIGFFMMMLLTMFQFSYGSSGGVKAIAAFVFLIFFVGIPSAIIYALYYRAQQVGFTSKAELDDSTGERDHTRSSRLLARIGIKGMPAKTTITSLNKGISESNEEFSSIHDDEDYTKKFGWLSARFRRTRWWFFAAWAFYEFIRACFYAGASGHPHTQVFGLLIVEFVAFGGLLWARPFEGRRLNLLVVYLLGFSKVATVALSAAFVTTFNLARITTTAIGIVIIVIQGVLTIVTMIAVVVGAISSYMSVMRNHEDFRPKRWLSLREKYFERINQATADMPPLPPPIPEEPKGPYFNVSSVRRVAKIEDEDPMFVSEMAMEGIDPKKSYITVSERPLTPIQDAQLQSDDSATPLRPRAVSRASARSVSHGSLPYGARAHRPSWSARDFAEWKADTPEGPSGTKRNTSGHGVTFAPTTSGAETSPQSGTPTPMSKAPLRSATMPMAMMQPMASMESLKFGGAISTPDTIGVVPSPTVRPRSGTYGGRSGNGSRSNTPTLLSRSATPAPRLELSRMALPAAEERDELHGELVKDVRTDEAT